MQPHPDPDLQQIVSDPLAVYVPNQPFLYVGFSIGINVRDLLQKSRVISVEAIAVLKIVSVNIAVVLKKHDPQRPVIPALSA